MAYLFGTIFFSFLFLFLLLIAIRLQWQWTNKLIFTSGLKLNKNHEIIRVLIIISFLTALSVLLQGVSFWLPVTLKYFWNAYIILPCLGGMMYGPLAGLLIGFFANSLATLIFPISGIWFFGMACGYALQGFIAGYITLLYLKKASFWNLFLSLNIFLITICLLTAGMLIFDQQSLQAISQNMQLSLTKLIILFVMSLGGLIILSNLWCLMMVFWIKTAKIVILSTIIILLSVSSFSFLISPIYYWISIQWPMIMTVLKNMMVWPVRILIDSILLSSLILLLTKIPNQQFLFTLSNVTPLPIKSGI